MKGNPWPALMVLAVLACGGWLWWKATRDPAIAFLPSRAGAEWIIYPKPPDTNPHKAAAMPATFRRSFTLERAPAHATLEICAFKQALVTLNHQPIPRLSLTGPDWKKARQAEVAPLLRPGTNELALTVTNDFGPPALWLRLTGAGLELRSDPQWEVSFAGAEWQPAVPASAPPRIRPGNHLFGREVTADSLRQRWPLLLLFLGLSALLVAVARRARRLDHPLVVPAVVVLALVVLFANNLPQLAHLLGFDRDGHLQYIEYILEKQALPLANEGWQMYQPPLYYLLSALTLAPLDLALSSDAALMVLRATAALMGILHVLLIWVCLRLLFPNQRGVQNAGLILAAFIPANLYLSHHITNEGLAALLVTASLYFTLRILKSSQPPMRLYAAAGGCLGLALLTKFSAVLAVPLVFGALAWHLGQRLRDKDKLEGKVRDKAASPFATLILPGKRLGLAAGTLLLLCGWHYARVWAHFGNPLIGNWDPTLGFAWWQDPGYRTAGWFWHFGQALTSPQFSSLHSFADGIYSSLWGDALWSGGSRVGFRPQWNYDLMNCSEVLALFTSALILAGGVILLRRIAGKPAAHSLLFAGLLFAFGFGLVYMALKVPSYGQVKAFYALPALLPLIVLAGLGWEGVKQMAAQNSGRIVPVLWVLLLTWAFTTYSAFWIRPGAEATHTIRGAGFLDDQRLDEAVQSYSRGSQLAPRAAAPAIGLVAALRQQGHGEEARTQAEAAVRQFPQEWEAHYQLGVVLAIEGHRSEAIGQLQEAIRLAPDNPTPYQDLALCFALNGQTNETVAACRAGLRVNPFNLALQTLLAKAVRAQ